jgi:hypothetical protein
MQPLTGKEGQLPPLTPADKQEPTAQQQIANLQAQLDQAQAEREKLVYLHKQADQNAQVVQQQNAILEAQLNSIAPDTGHVHILVSRHNNVLEVGLFDTQPGGQPAWAVRRHTTAPHNKIKWSVPGNVAINSIKGKSDPLPITVQDPGGAPGKPFMATVDAGNSGDPPTTTYDYLIDVTYDPNGSAIRLVIDPEFIVNRP